MYCPETVIACNSVAYICHHGAGDVPWYWRPIMERINPLRWELRLIERSSGGYLLSVNKGGRWHRRVSDGIFRIKQACRRARV